MTYYAIFRPNITYNKISNLFNFQTFVVCPVCHIRSLISGSTIFYRVHNRPPINGQCTTHRITVQEAQLSQRDRATLRVIEYFAKSLKVMRYANTFRRFIVLSNLSSLISITDTTVIVLSMQAYP